MLENGVLYAGLPDYTGVGQGHRNFLTGRQEKKSGTVGSNSGQMSLVSIMKILLYVALHKKVEKRF